MHLFKSFLEGLYKPTFFNLLINKNEVLDSNNVIKEIHSHIFFHEYIHFLQDVLTSFGLRNICTLARKLSIINHEIIDSADTSFSIPFKSKNSSLKNETDLFNMFWGTAELPDEDRDFAIINLEKHPNLFNPALADRSFINVNITYRDNLDKECFYLGAIHFMEGIAHILERNYEVGIDAPPFPYKIVEKIIRTVFSEGDFTERNFILIMETALEAHDPAECFYNFYHACNADGLPFTEETIARFRREYKMKWDGKRYLYASFYYPNVVMAKEAFKALFNHHEQLVQLNEWSKILLKNAVKIRRAGFSFTDLLVSDGRKELVEKNLSRIIHKLGTPVMSDGRFGIFMLSPERKIPEETMIHLLSLEAVSNILDGDTTCSILPFCKYGKHGIDISDGDCISAPWNRTKKKPYCPLAKIWIMWGFVKKDVSV
ncbi:MAG: hypothetical protein DI535_00745 [Citrobacter freundii]|nr:MAG: hypothetical protein DI535_00745 [Citrobacter freundii]